MLLPPFTSGCFCNEPCKRGSGASVLAPTVPCCIACASAHAKGVLGVAGSSICSQRKAFAAKPIILSISFKALQARASAEPCSLCLPHKSHVPGRQSCGMAVVGRIYLQTRLFLRPLPSLQAQDVTFARTVGSLSCSLFYCRRGSSSSSPARPGEPCCLPGGVSRVGIFKAKTPMGGRWVGLRCRPPAERCAGGTG